MQVTQFLNSINHQGLRWNVHCVANVRLRKQLNRYKRGFKIYDLLVPFLCHQTQTSDLLCQLRITQSLMFTRQMFKPKHTDNVKDIFSLLCVKCIFLWLYRSVRHERINKYAKKGITSSMKCIDLANFTFRCVTDKILFTLQVYFARSRSF